MKITFLAAELIFAGVWIAARALIAAVRKKIDWKREALLLFMYVNLAVILRIAFFPMERVNGRVQPLWFLPEYAFPPRVNFLPFVHMFSYDTQKETLLNVLGNVGMFIPTGILLPVLFPKLASFPKTVAAGALMSLAVELLQLPFFSRASDVDDLILNTTGVVIGFGIWALVRALAERKRA